MGKNNDRAVLLMFLPESMGSPAFTNKRPSGLYVLLDLLPDEIKIGLSLMTMQLGSLYLQSAVKF